MLNNHEQPVLYHTKIAEFKTLPKFIVRTKHACNNIKEYKTHAMFTSPDANTRGSLGELES